MYGPWEEQGQPLWYNGPDEEVQRTGHADIFEDADGRWWAVLLGVRPLWDEDGPRWLEPQLGSFPSHMHPPLAEAFGPTTADVVND